ncbi:MAG: hemolysin family protein [Thermodesulfobacterium sp.]|nr:hemolysin family protein [Thermodesulfobacterium sp.]
MATLVLIMCSIIFSSSEASIFSLNRLEMASLRSLSLSEKYLRIFKNPDELLIVLITGNEIVDYFASFCFSNGLSYLIQDEGRKIAFIIFSIISFWIGDFFPKVLGFKFKTKMVCKIIPITYAFYQILYPLRKVFILIYQKIEAIFPIKAIISYHSLPSVEKIILNTLEIAYKERRISQKEKEFIYGLFLSEKIPVSVIMTSRSEIVAFKDQVITLEFLEKIKNLPYNKFPVYKTFLDEVIGILYTKDLIKGFQDGNIFQRKLSEFVRPAYFVPEGFKVRDLLFEFQKRHLKIALVIDEYGILKGLVTLEDLLEELFGEIYEEREFKMDPIQRLDENRWLISGKVLLEDLKNILSLEINEEELRDLKTLNGALLVLFKELPKEGESVEYQGYKFSIKKMKGRKIFWVEVEKL